MDWLFKNKISPVEPPVTTLCRNCDLEQLFQQNDELPEEKFKEILEKTEDLLLRSRLYIQLDVPSGGDTSMTCKNNEDVTEEDVLNSLCYNQKESALAYDLCLEFLAKSNRKFNNNTVKSKEFPKKGHSSVLKNYIRTIPKRRRPLHLRLRSLTKRVKFLRQNVENANANIPDGEIPSSLSSSPDDNSNSSCFGDYETEDTCKNRPRRNNVHRGIKFKVPYRHYNRRQRLLELEWRSKKNARRKVGNQNQFWPVNCCSERPQLRQNTNVRYILEFSVKTLFLFICVRVLMDALQVNEYFEDYDFESD